MAKKKKKTKKQKKYPSWPRNTSDNCIAGIPIETCNIKNVRQSNIGMVYLGNKESNNTTQRKVKDIEPIVIPKETITPEKIPDIYVYRGYLTVPKQNLIDYYMFVNDVSHTNRYKIIVAYNKVNRRYYMGIKQLEKLHKNNCFPEIVIHESTEGSEPLYVGDFRQASELGMYGYKVGKSGLPKKRRHEILKYVIDEKILRRYEIVSLLNGNITLREYRSDRDFSKAISDWEEDIDFVNDYRS